MSDPRRALIGHSSDVGAGVYRELANVLAVLVDAILGDLWFNSHPAQVFMGDTGSLPIGTLLGLAAL